jgi:ribosomal protein S18 acetylase RimI-like enzyme
MNDTVAVRRLTAADAALFRDIRLHALKTEPREYASTHADWCDRPLSDFEDLLRTVRYVGAEQDRALLGICGWHPLARVPTRHRGAVVGVFVRAEWRRRGLFSRMLDAVVEDATGQVRQLELHVCADNHAALAAYRAHGFAQIGRIPAALAHEGGFADELSMLRPLTA